MAQAIVIGAGFAGLSCATALAKRGYRVTVLEKNDQPGGRCRMWEQSGFTFDMGPSWYWMPEVFEEYFARYGHKVSDFYELVRLDPSYQVVFGPNDVVPVPAQMTALRALFEQLEPGAGARLDEFLRQAAYKYRVGMGEFVWKPSRSVREFLDPRLVVDAVRLDLLQSMSRHVRKFFKHPHLIKLLEFPVLFLGATPQNTPALYSLMNYADLALGTWYPLGGMYQIVRGMVTVAQENGVEIRCSEAVTQIEVSPKGRATAVITSTGRYEADVVVAGADYHHIEQHVLPAAWRTYDEPYWQSRTMAPSSLLFYLGINRKCERLLHHTLFFDEDFDVHARDIYTSPRWPDRPLFYVSATSKTDPTAAPPDGENLFVLMPVAPGLTDDDDTVRERYYQLLLTRLEAFCGHPIRPHVVVKRSYAHRDFQADYHAFQGNAYGLANTLRQTAILKPALKSARVQNLYFTGQLTVPGPGVPPSLISGEVVAREIARDLPVNAVSARQGHG